MKQLLQGNEACLMGAIRAGMNFYAGYPITPSTEIAELASEVLPKAGGVYMQMEDEIASLAAAIGASLTGAKAMTATSGPGFSLMQELIGYAIMAEAPVLIAVIMRVGPSTGLPTAVSQGDVMQARWGTHGDHTVICLCPSSVEEMYWLTMRGMALAEKYRMPVILLSDAVLGHMLESVELNRDLTAIRSDVPEHQKTCHDSCDRNGIKERQYLGMGCSMHVTGLIHDEKGFPSNRSDTARRLLTRLNCKVKEDSPDFNINTEWSCGDARYLIVAYGSVASIAFSVGKRLREEGVMVGVFVPQVLWPFRETELDGILAGGVEIVFVAELNLGQYIHVIRSCANQRGIKTVSCAKSSGEQFLVDELYAMVRGEIGL